MKSILYSIFLSILPLGLWAQSTERGLSLSGTTAYVAGDFDYAGFYGFSFSGDVHVTLTNSEKFDVALSAGFFQLTGIDGIEGEGFLKGYASLLVNNLFTENQHFVLSVGYASSQSDRIEVNGLYLEGLYQFELSEKFSLAPGVFVIAGIPDSADTVSSNVVLLGVRGTLQL